MLRRIGRLIFKLIPLWSWRILLYGAFAAVVAAGALILGLRYWVLPDIEAYRGDLERLMSAATGQRIAIGAISADWRGLRPQFTLGNVTVHDHAGRPARELERIDTSLAWSSLVFLEPRFHTLEVREPSLAVRRAPDGTVSIGGIVLRAGEGRPGLADWVLRQPALAILGASVSWLDEQRGAPELRLEQVTARLVNDFHRHRFGLQARGPDGVLGSIDLRADLAGRSVRDPREWQGQLYLRIEGANLAAYKQWIDLPVDVDRGQGTLRLWADLAEQRVTAVTTDVHLADVVATLGPGLAPLALDELAGRVGWRSSLAGSEIFVRSLRAAAASGHGFEPLDFDLRRFAAQPGKPARGEMHANALDLGALAHFAEHLPIEPALRAGLVRYAPRGRVTGLTARWSGEWPELQYEVKARFRDLAVTAVGAMPGLANVSGSVEATERRGTLTLANRNMRIELPRAFAHPLAFDTLTADIGWSASGGRYDIRFERVEFANADVAGSFHGSYHTAADGPGSADLVGTLTRADMRRVAYYLPLAVSSGTREWVRDAVLAGEASDIEWRLKGDLARFPFGPGEGTLEVVARAHGGLLEYAPGWPRIEDITADIRFVGKRMEVHAQSASILGAQLRVRAVIPDLEHHYEILQVEGEAQAPSSEFLRFIEASPVAAMMDRFLDGMEAQGRGRLVLALEMPLREPERSRVTGSYEFASNRLRVDPGLPPLEQVDGRIEFTERSVQGRNIAARIFGGPATIALATRDGGLQVQASGRASVEALRAGATTSPLAQALSGTFDWRSTIQVRGRAAEVVLESELKGVTSALPVPLAKEASESVPLRIERRASGDEDSIDLHWGKSVVAHVARRRKGKELVVERAAIGLGTEAPVAEGPGVWLRGTLPALDLDAWRALLAKDAGPTPALAAVDLEVGALDVFGRRFHDVTLRARRTDQWRLRLVAREADGQIGWRTEGQGEIVARLQRLALPAPLGRVAAGTDEQKPATEPPRGYPALDLVVEEFSNKERALGRLELRALPQPGGWRIEHLQLRNSDATLAADGYWRWQDRVPSTQMSLRLDVADIGKFLARLRYPEGVRGGTATLTGTLGWNGSPQDLDYPTLSGDIAVEAARGQFARLEPGIGKLLSILSLQALPRRVTLDFKDVFSEGFAFDAIEGKVKIQRGVATTEAFRVTGPSARVVMSGDVDLSRETQALRVRVTPSVGDSVATVTALLGGPVAGIGVFLAQKLLNDPLGQLIAYDYSITGTWSDPVVTRLGLKPGPG